MIVSNTGKGKKNHPADLAILQLLFNDFTIYEVKGPNGQIQYSLQPGANKDGYKALPKLKVDGKDEAAIAFRIEAYQKAKSMAVIDGWASPSGNTIKSILKDAAITAGETRMTYIRKKISPALKCAAIKPATVVSLYEKQYKSLPSADKTGLEYILKTGKGDSDIKRITEFSYMLATTKHETAHTFRPIAEYGKGKGLKYGAEITVTHTDAAKKTTTQKNVYYGRGYVQLTWGYNYQRIDEKLGNGNYPNKSKTKASDYNTGFTISKPTDSIYLYPDKALNKENAYIAMVYGMQKGIFTGRRVDRYINDLKTDYINARRVINGTDKANAIARYAEDIEILLRVSTK